MPYLAGGAERGGYTEVISPACAIALRPGDVLMLDTGLVRVGYLRDFYRNWSAGAASQQVRDAYAMLMEASDAVFKVARPGATAAELFHLMNKVLSRTSGETGAGRLGHGLGMPLTEWPLLIPRDHTVLEPGMVLKL